jgi:ATP-dependent helicase/nuclease subunit B
MKPLKFYTLPPSYSVLSVLTDFLLAQNKQDPFMLSKIHVILPTRRSVRKLKQLLLDQASSSTLLLPRMQAINDLTPPLGDTILPEIPKALRLGLIFNLIRAEKAHLQTFPSIELAEELCAFIDTLQSEEVDLSKLTTIIPDQFAHHWQLTFRFLHMLQQKWPGIVQAHNYLEPWMYRRAVWDATRRMWEKKTPDHPIIAAGLNGAVPAVGRLLKSISALPQGQVILPGFDLTLSLEYWQAIKPGHPQFSYKRFFEREAIDPRAVEYFPAINYSSSERDLTPSALMSNDLSQVKMNLADIRILELETPHDEALSIALYIREKLANSGQTIAIVSADKQFGKRLRMELQRWKVDIDDSVGIPLTETALGQLMLLTANIKEFDADPAHTLAILKHPFTCLGLSRLELLKLVRILEIQVLRAQKELSDLSCPLLDRISHRCQTAHKNNLIHLMKSWQDIIKPFLELSKKQAVPFKIILETHLTLLEHLSSKSTLWDSEAGQLLVPHLQDLLMCSDSFENMTCCDYVHFLKVLLKQITLHEPFTHPRVQLLGPIESRLIQADLVILANVNEGSWPTYPKINPWLNRSMRSAIGLPDPETHIGEEALDFMLALGNKNVLLTRSLRTDGNPTTPSRWLLRLKAIASCHNIDLSCSHSIHTWRYLLDQPPAELKITEPAPCPPLSVRPLRMSISDIDLLLKDAYAFYAKNILKLAPLDHIEITMTPALFGSWLHRILQNHPTAEQLSRFILDEGIDPIWAYQFKQVKEWLLTQDEFRIPPRILLTEERLSRQWNPIEVVGKADRIQINLDGIDIIDYKTGTVPTQQEIKEGYAPQLPLLALLAESTLNQRILKMAYWDLKKQDIRSLDDVESIITLYQQTVEKLFTTYLLPETVFKSQSLLKGDRYNPYQHLRRAQEWLNNNI